VNIFSNFTVPRRTAQPGPELTLLHEALNHGLPIGNDGEATYFHEPRLPTGFPDLVAVFSKQTSITLSPSRLRLDVCHLRLLYHIHSVGNTTVEALVHALMWKSHDLAERIDDLEESDLVYVRGKNIRPKTLNEVFAVSKIVALEAKISHWQKALAQAVANTWFASQSYILLPKGQGATKAAVAAQQFGIGVLVFDGLKTTRLVNPVKFEIPSSYGSWLINEWAIRSWFTGEQNDRLSSTTGSFPRSFSDSVDPHY